MDSMLIEASGVEVALVPSYAQTLVLSGLESALLVPSASLPVKETAMKHSPSGFFHSDGDNASTAPKRFQEPTTVAVAATTTPSAANAIMDSTSKLAMQPDIPTTVTPNIPLSAADLSQKQELLQVSASPIHSENGQHSRKLEEPEEISEFDQAVPCHRAPESFSQSTSALAVKYDSFTLMLSGQAPATIFIIPNVDAGAILNQAAALKFKMELAVANRRNGLEDPNAPIILNNEEKAFRTFISAAMTGAANDRTVLRPSGGYSVLQAVAAAAVVGAIGSWAVLAFV